MTEVLGLDHYSIAAGDVGGVVEIGHVAWSGRWRLDVSDVTVRVPELEGPAADVLSIAQMTLQIGPFDRGWIRDVTIRDATLQLIVSVQQHVRPDCLRKSRIGSMSGQQPKPKKS